MKNFYLLGMKGIRDCNNRKVQLEYYLTETIKEFAKQISEDEIFMYAAQGAFYMITA